MGERNTTSEKLKFLAGIYRGGFICKILGLSVYSTCLYRKEKVIPKKLTAEKIDKIYQETMEFLKRIGELGEKE